MNISLVNLATIPTSFNVVVSGPALGVIHVVVYRLNASGQLPVFAQYNLALPTTTNIPAPAGLYLATAFDDSGYVAMASTVVTTGLDAVLTRLRTAIVGVISGLGLPLSGGVLPEWTPDDSEMDMPCVVVTHENTTPTESQTVVGTRDVGYPIRVMIFDRVSKYEHDKMPDYDAWRLAIEDAFANKRVPGVVESLTNEIEHDTLVDQRGPAYSEMVSQFIIRANCRLESS